MNTAVFIFLTREDLRLPRIGRQFVELVISHLNEMRPKIYGITEPLNRNFDEDPTAFNEYWEHDVFWRNPLVNGYGRVLHGTPRRHSSIKMYFESETSNSQLWGEALKQMSRLFEADYACVHYFYKSRTAEDEILEGLTSHHLKKWLPNIAWGSCFGLPYIELIGRDKFEASSFYYREWLSDHLIYCQLTPDAQEYIDDYDNFRARQMQAKLDLGLQFFLNSTAPQREALAPSFGFNSQR